MPRESIEEKAHRYLTEGRLTIRSVRGQAIRAEARGATVYRLGCDVERGWWCDCPARVVCAHLTGLCLVAVEREED